MFKIKVNKSSNIKLNQRQLGPYQIKKIDALKKTYQLKKLDKTKLNKTFARNKIKKFIERKQYFYKTSNIKRKGESKEKTRLENKPNLKVNKENKRLVSRQRKILIKIPRLPQDY